MAITLTPTTPFAKNATIDAHNVLHMISIILFAIYAVETEKMKLNAIAKMDFLKEQYQAKIAQFVTARV